ncbi:MAG: TIGR03986 family CRISPR-associated RAMP protein [Chloroflexota bacterium]
MVVKHQNPTEERCYTLKAPKPKKGIKGIYTHVKARAPYNFIPLPEKIVHTPSPLSPHDRYDPDRMTGWIDCELETCSPTYIRGMLTEAQWREFGDIGNEDLTEDEKKAKSAFFSKDALNPVLPGSSLRGMIRALVEIVGHGRMRWVAAQPTFTFRAVAAPKDDPLTGPYQAVMGRFGVNVHAGYLSKKGEQWIIHPAVAPAQKWDWEKLPYLKVKERNVEKLANFVRFNDKGYKPTYYPISFSSEKRFDSSGRPYLAITAVSRDIAALENRGTLVCTGNMLETSDGTSESPRKNHAIVLDADKKTEVTIPPEVLETYRNSLTDFQKSDLWGGEDGCLKIGAPVFYTFVGGKVIAFGHTPNFRIPVVPGSRAITPQDFVPKKIREDPLPDVADALFGWVEEDKWGPHQPPHYAGRVFFSDAYCESDGDVWYSNDPIVPHVLASPKVTTFQHYLTQDGMKHNPDKKETLAYYGTPTNEANIRGYKMYWHKGKNPNIQATDEERKKTKDTQFTQIRPVKAGIKFKFTIRFENLHPEELGALWWALELPGNAQETYYHKLGMGKPLGMGAVKINPKLHLSRRVARKKENGEIEKGRYDALFANGSTWHTPDEDAVEGVTYRLKFEEFMKDNDIELDKSERINILLEMLRWRGDNPGQDWLEITRYMEIEHGKNKINEYKERPVLPTPMGIQDDLKRPDCEAREEVRFRNESAERNRRQPRPRR